MFRISLRNLSAVSNLLKQTPKIIDNGKQCLAIVKLPYNLIQTASLTEGRKVEEIKSPLGKLIKETTEKSKQESEKPDEEDEAKQREKAWRTMKYSLWFLGISMVSVGGYMIFTLGAPTPETDVLYPDIKDKPTWMQYLIRTYRECIVYTKLIQEPSRDKLLPDPLKYPYIQPKYTLVLELTDLLVHPEWTYSTGWRFKKRPGLDYFLESLHGVYEIVVYTAEQGMTVFLLCDAIDPKNIILYKLPRDTTQFHDGHHVKSLDKLNRDLSKVIVVDWNSQSVKFHPENLFQVRRWTGNDNDNDMIELTAFLKSIADNDVEDVREVLQNFKGYDDPLEAFREKRKRLFEQMESEAEAQKHQDPKPVQRWAPSIFAKRF